MGRGAGCYHRSLRFVRADAPRVAMRHEGDLLDELPPVERHDVAMTAPITPAGGDVGFRSP